MLAAGNGELTIQKWLPPGPPLVTLLSQALVAFTIELDNEFEHRSPHRTTKHGGGVSGGPWLVSSTMFLNCIRFVDAQGIRVRDLIARARTKTNLHGMLRWGYITMAPDPADRRARIPKADFLIYATPKGLKARETWTPLFDEVEQRWETRFGREAMGRLRRALCALVSLFDMELPDCMPILRYGLAAGGKYHSRMAGTRECADVPLSIAAMLARALVAFAIEYELKSDPGLPLAANVLRVLAGRGVRMAELPQVSGVSKESIAMALGYLQKRKLAVVETEAPGNRKRARLTERGEVAAGLYRQTIATVEEQWMARYGRDVVLGVREPLEAIAGDGTATGSPLFLGLESYPDGWRAKVPRPATMPHYPMVLHRGGFPDGS